MEIKTNDTVIVITGKYKGAKGKVLKTSPKNHTVIVEGVNFVYKHKKARKANETARIVRFLGASSVVSAGAAFLPLPAYALSSTAPHFLQMRTYFLPAS